MKTAWDQRARENAWHFIATGKTNWTEEEFFASGERTVADHILTDMPNICQGKSADRMRVLEIGCGAGRITRALARTFGEVHAVDVSGEMLRRARTALLQCPNVRLYENNGMDLTVIPELTFDFAFSYLVFQHIPSYQVIKRYVQETNRLLVPGGLFKFQVRGNTADESKGTDTWVGFAFSDERARAMARDSGFEARFQAGAGSQDFWLWFFKPHEAQKAPMAAPPRLGWQSGTSLTETVRLNFTFAGSEDPRRGSSG
ncbi:MAG: methyltransferase domain-containing protein [Bryobacteraceae bacterium]